MGELENISLGGGMRRWTVEALVDVKWHLFIVWKSYEKGRWEGCRGKKKVGVGVAVVKDMGTMMEDYNRAKQVAKGAIFRKQPSTKFSSGSPKQ